MPNTLLHNPKSIKSPAALTCLSRSLQSGFLCPLPTPYCPNPHWVTLASSLSLCLWSFWSWIAVRPPLPSPKRMKTKNSGHVSLVTWCRCVLNALVWNLPVWMVNFFQTSISCWLCIGVVSGCWEAHNCEHVYMGVILWFGWALSNSLVWKASRHVTDHVIPRRWHSALVWYLPVWFVIWMSSLLQPFLLHGWFPQRWTFGGGVILCHPVAETELWTLYGGCMFVWLSIVNSSTNLWKIGKRGGVIGTLSIEHSASCGDGKSWRGTTSIFALAAQNFIHLQGEVKVLLMRHLLLTFVQARDFHQEISRSNESRSIGEASGNQTDNLEKTEGHTQRVSWVFPWDTCYWPFCRWDLHMRGN